MSPLSIAARPSAKPRAARPDTWISAIRPPHTRRQEALQLSQRYDFWTPGDAATLHVPELAEVLDYRDDHACVVEQAPGTETWIRIPLLRPRLTPNQPDQTTTQILFFTLAARLNRSVRIDLLNLYRGDDLIYCQPVCLSGGDYDAIFDALPANRPNRVYDGGVMLDMHLTFLPGAERGRIELRGVGSGFA